MAKAKFVTEYDTDVAQRDHAVERLRNEIIASLPTVHDGQLVLEFGEKSHTEYDKTFAVTSPARESSEALHVINDMISLVTAIPAEKIGTYGLYTSQACMLSQKMFANVLWAFGLKTVIYASVAVMTDYERSQHRAAEEYHRWHGTPKPQPSIRWGEWPLKLAEHPADIIFIRGDMHTACVAKDGDDQWWHAGFYEEDPLWNQVRPPSPAKAYEHPAHGGQCVGLSLHFALLVAQSRVMKARFLPPAVPIVPDCAHLFTFLGLAAATSESYEVWAHARYYSDLKVRSITERRSGKPIELETYKIPSRMSDSATWSYQVEDPPPPDDRPADGKKPRIEPDWVKVDWAAGTWSESRRLEDNARHWTLFVPRRGTDLKFPFLDANRLGPTLFPLVRERPFKLKCDPGPLDSRWTFRPYEVFHLQFQPKRGGAEVPLEQIHAYFSGRVEDPGYQFTLAKGNKEHPIDVWIKEYNRKHKYSYVQWNLCPKTDASDTCVMSVSFVDLASMPQPLARART